MGCYRWLLQWGGGLDRAVTCPPLLYALYMEPILERLLRNPRIKGVTIASTEHKLALYAGDVLLTLSDSLESVPAFLEEAQLFQQAAGFKINIQKSSIINVSVPGDMQDLLSQ